MVKVFLFKLANIFFYIFKDKKKDLKKRQLIMIINVIINWEKSKKSTPHPLPVLFLSENFKLGGGILNHIRNINICQLDIKIFATLLLNIFTIKFNLFPNKRGGGICARLGTLRETCKNCKPGWRNRQLFCRVPGQSWGGGKRFRATISTTWYWSLTWKFRYMFNFSVFSNSNSFYSGEASL